MFRHILQIILIGLSLAVGTGCKQQEPTFPTDRDLNSSEDPSQALLPTPLSIPYNADLMKGRASEPDFSKLTAPKQPESNADVELAPEDVAGVKATLPNILKHVTENNWDQLPSYFVPEQAEQIQKFVPLISQLMEKMIAFNKAFAEKLAADNSEVNQQLAAMMKMNDPQQLAAILQPLLALAPVKGMGPTHAKLTLSLPMVPGQSVEVPFAKTDQGWKIELPHFPLPAQIDQIKSMLEGTLPAFLQKVDEISQQLKDGALDVQQAAAAVQQSAMMWATQLGTLFGSSNTSNPSPKSESGTENKPAESTAEDTGEEKKPDEQP